MPDEILVNCSDTKEVRVIADMSLTHCKECHSQLVIENFLIPTDNKFKRIITKRCPTCSFRYLGYVHYYKYKPLFTAINETDLEEVQYQYLYNMVKTNAGLPKKSFRQELKRLPLWVTSKILQQINDYEKVINPQDLLQLSCVELCRIIAFFHVKREGKPDVYYFLSNLWQPGKKINSDKNIVYLDSHSSLGQTIIYGHAFNNNKYEFQGRAINIVYSKVFDKSEYQWLISSMEMRLEFEEYEDEDDTPLASKAETIHVYYKFNNLCTIRHHDVISVTLETIDAKNGKHLNVNAYFCQQCNKYFINYEALSANYLRKGIFPLFKYIYPENVLDGLNETSKLMRYGYTVRAGALSEQERHNILIWIINAGLMKKNEIIHDLQFKINYNGQKPGNEAAREKWKRDIKFISEYVEDNTHTLTPLKFE